MKNQKSTILFGCALATQAAFSGGCLIILIVLLPFWKNIDSIEFITWFSNNSRNLGTTMILLEVLSLVLFILLYFNHGRGGRFNADVLLAINPSNLSIVFSHN